MPDDELTTTVRRLETSLGMISTEWGEFLELEAERRKADADERRHRAESDSQRASMEVEAWQKGQTFLAKHGMKIAGVLFTAVTAGLAWYGAQIRAEIQKTQRAKDVDDKIQINTENLADFKYVTEDSINTLQRESVNQTLMIDEGFKRVDKIMLKATKLKEEDLPEIPPEFNTAIKEAKELQLHSDRFESSRKKPPASE